MGLDSLSTGETIGWAMECVEKGIFDLELILTASILPGAIFETVERILDLIVNQQRHRG